jgi:hypothetical protein
MQKITHLVLLASVTALGFGCAADDSHYRVRGVVEAERDALSHCYADVLELDRDADGVVHVAFTMDEEGGVDDVTVDEGTMNDEDLPVCISTVLSRVRMDDPPSEKTRLAYTLRFRPHD